MKVLFLSFFFLSSSTSCSFPLWWRQRCYEITRRMSGRSSARVVSQTTLRHFGPQRDASSAGNQLHHQTGEGERFFRLFSHCLALWCHFWREIELVCFFVLYNKNITLKILIKKIHSFLITLSILCSSNLKLSNHL